ncbi:hypothetical protein K505DRAFT_326703 [Melanomma pulvis-pyrius CBS 109.77]|uniref:Uncharacterized protein n=1 Tax=Melanomma pulvis-pyrius CBS 109.77 TaxID=1314802 RepID=A0A6A6X6T8_9PLEO|nr:hypothetical protein K505DRAFT_326703 [Melanomma pulvis-pyrius CBS 109.77]
MRLTTLLTLLLSIGAILIAALPQPPTTIDTAPPTLDQVNTIDTAAHNPPSTHDAKAPRALIKPPAERGIEQALCIECPCLGFDGRCTCIPNGCCCGRMAGMDY